MAMLWPWQARPVLGNRGNMPALVLAQRHLFHGRGYVCVLTRAAQGSGLCLDLS
jgi:hypothetical protein